MADLELTTVPRDLYYHEVAYVRRLESALKEAKQVLGCLDHPQNGFYSGLDMIRDGKKIGDIIDAALADRAGDSR